MRYPGEDKVLGSQLAACYVNSKLQSRRRNNKNFDSLRRRLLISLNLVNGQGTRPSLNAIIYNLQSPAWSYRSRGRDSRDAISVVAIYSEFREEIREIFVRSFLNRSGFSRFYGAG